MFLVLLRNESIDHSSFRSVGSLFHARGAATEKALSLICRCVCGMTRSPLYEAHSADRAGISAAGVSKSKMYYGVCPKSDKWTSKLSLYWILSVTGNQCNSWTARVTRSCGFTRSCGLRSRTVENNHRNIQLKNTITQNKLKQLTPRFGWFENGPLCFHLGNRVGPFSKEKVSKERNISK